MDRRTFLRRSPAVAGGLWVATSGIAHAADVKRALSLEDPADVSSMAHLNRHIKEVWFPHNVPSPHKGQLQQRYHTTWRFVDGRIYVVFFTGLKESWDTSICAGQWLAWPASQNLETIDKWRYWHASVSVAMEDLCMQLGCTTTAMRSSAYSPGDCFDLSARYDAESLPLGLMLQERLRDLHKVVKLRLA